MFDSRVLLVGEKINYEDFKQMNIAGIISGRRWLENTEDIPIYNYDYLLHRPIDEKIIVVDDNWDFDVLYEFNTLMQNLGLRIGKDYTYNSMLKSKIDTNRIYRLLDNSKEDFHALMNIILENRQLVIVHGNCQAHVICNMLSNNEEFKRKYVVCEMPKLWMQGHKEEYTILYESGVLSLGAYLLTQKISVYNKFERYASSEYMISQVSNSCKVILIPNLYFRGYFPQLKKYDQEVKYRWWQEESIFPSDNRCIETEVLRLMIQGKSDEEIVREISCDDYYSEEFLYHNAEKELAEYKEREESIDIKLWDFLVDNYNKFLMFATPNHPTRDVLLELTRRILKALQITDMDILCDNNEIQAPCPQWLYTPMYPSVLKAFGFRDRKYYFSSKLRGGQ